MPKPLWEDRRFRLFLSHTSQEKKKAGALKTALVPYAVDVFVAHEDIAPTREWEAEVIRALDSCDAIAALLTAGFHASEWTDQETGYAIRRGILIIPIMAGVDPYGFMSRFQGLHASGRYARQVADDIFDVLVFHRLTEDSIADAVVWQFTQSDSFAVARANMTLIERLSRLTEEQVKEIRKAVKSNGQINKSYGVPDRLQDLVKRHKEALGTQTEQRRQ